MGAGGGGCGMGRGGEGRRTSFRPTMRFLPLGYCYSNPIARVIVHLDKKCMLLIGIMCFAYIRTDSPLAKLYTTSTLEHHHFNHAVIILSTEVSE